jgi:hypothetical protein
MVDVICCNTCPSIGELLEQAYIMEVVGRPQGGTRGSGVTTLEGPGPGDTVELGS